MALSLLLLKPKGSFVSIPFAFGAFRVSSSLQLLHPCSFSISASPPPSSFSVSASPPPLQLPHLYSSLPSLTIPATPPPPRQLLLHSSLLWAFILCCLCSQIHSLQVILCHLPSKLSLWVWRKNKPISVKPLTIFHSQTQALCSRSKAFQGNCVLGNRPQGSVSGILIFTWALYSLHRIQI